MDWLQKVQPQEEYILILDADMIMLKPFDPVKMGVLPGLPCTAWLYMHTAAAGFAGAPEICQSTWLQCRYKNAPKLGCALDAGWGVSAFYGYLQGVNNELALKHVPHVAPRNDSLAGPVGRRGDQVGTCYHSASTSQSLPHDFCGGGSSAFLHV